MTQIELDTMRTIVLNLPSISASLSDIAAKLTPKEEEKQELTSKELDIICLALNFLECNIEEEEVEDAVGVSYCELEDMSERIKRKLNIGED